MTRILPHDHEHGFATRAVHAGQIPEPLAGAVMTPIYQTSTYVQDGLGKHKGYEYGRTQNPTREALERNVASLEGATHGFAFGSGLAALDAVLKLFKSGDHIVCGENVYGGSHRLMERIYARLGLTFTFVDMRDVGNVERALTPATRMIYCETPTNPMMNLTDLRGGGRSGPGPRLPLSWWTTPSPRPFFQRPLEFGADLVLHSTTKYLNGHSDMVGGLLVTAATTWPSGSASSRTRPARCPGRWTAGSRSAGIKTLPLRMRQHDANGRRIAEWLTHQRGGHEGLLSRACRRIPQHELACRQMSGFGGMISLDLGDAGRARRFVEAHPDLRAGRIARRGREPDRPPGLDDPRLGAGRHAAGHGADRQPGPPELRDRGRGGPDRGPGAGAWQAETRAHE